MTSARRTNRSTLRRGALALALLLCGIAGISQAQEIRKFFTGNGKALWLVSAEANTFDLITRPTGGKWKYQEQKITGDATAACADAGALHLLFRDGAHLVYGPDPNFRAIPSIGLPRGVSPIAACTAMDLGQAGPSILVIARRSMIAKSSASTATFRLLEATTTSQPASRLTVYQSTPDSWKVLAELDLPSDGKLFAATLDKTLYVLLCSADGENRLLAWRGGKISQSPLKGLPEGARVTALINDEKQILLLFAQATPDAARATLQIASSINPLEDFTQPSQPVSMDGKAVLVPKSSPLLATRVGGQVALLWQEGQAWQLTTCDTSGRAGPTEAVNLPDHSQATENGQDIMNIFFWVLMFGTAPLWMFRPRAARPILLPPLLQPARLPRRILAGIVDFLPFLFLQGLVTYYQMRKMGIGSNIQLDSPDLKEKIMAVSTSDLVSYGRVATLACYTAYGVIMEKFYGATLGKMLLRLRVVNDISGPLGWREAIVRNVLRTLEILTPPLPIFLLWPLVNRHRLRMGDILARTIVVEVAVTMPPYLYPPGSEQNQQVPPRQGDDEPRE